MILKSSNLLVLAMIASQVWDKLHMPPPARDLKLLFYILYLTEYILYIIIVGCFFCLVLVVRCFLVFLWLVIVCVLGGLCFVWLCFCFTNSCFEIIKTKIKSFSLSMENSS